MSHYDTCLALLAYCELLQFAANWCILSVCLIRMKGGSRDYHGTVPNTRGGSRTATASRRDSQAAFATRKITWIQTGRFLARQCRRLARVDEATEKHTNQITGANQFGLSVLHSLPIVSQALSSELVCSTSLSILAWFMAISKDGEAAGRGYDMLYFYRGNLS